MQLDEMDQRILGSLMEKQRTVPATYPLTVNGLRTACNQQNSREPVTSYEDRELELRCRDLRERGLVRVVAVGRTLKYHQLLDEVLSLQPDEHALLTVLLLRGAQAPGALKTRTERLYGFRDREQVEEVLARMAALPEPLVRELPRRPGDKDHRWIHLLGPVPELEGLPVSVTPVDRESVLADGAHVRDERVRAAYDAAAASAPPMDWEARPFDRWLVERVAAEAVGPIIDVGTGAGHVVELLARAGADVTGQDLSPQMIARARELYPDREFEVGDFAKLMRPPTASGWAAVTAWDALAHLAASELPDAVASLARVLDPGGQLVIALELGDEMRPVDALWGEPVDLAVVRHDRAQVVAAVRAAGLVDVESYVRSPLPGEPESDRLYVRATKP